MKHVGICRTVSCSAAQAPAGVSKELQDVIDSLVLFTVIYACYLMTASSWVHRL